MIFIKDNPFIPIKYGNTVIIDGRINEEILHNLKKLNLKVVKTIKCEEVDESISYHPDIVIHPINHNTLMVAPNVFDYYEEKLYGMGISLIKGEKFLQSRYPYDIAYNVGRLKDIAIHNFKYTDEKLKYYLKKENLQLIDIKQGYTKCSLAIIGENIAITSDYPIYNKLQSIGYKMLFIEPGHILLEGQKYGFIGGATGNLSKDIVLISGNLHDHPEKNKILNFIQENNKHPIFLSKQKIVDIGTIISLYCH